jgi:histidine phosphotransferase ChpT
MVRVMMLEELLMAELLCTRLCHDLTGPIGAVNNGAEFLSEEGFNLQNQAVELITSSAFSAVTRLQFYRMSYGKVRDHGEASLAEKQKLASDFFADSKITLDWPDNHTDAVGVSISLKMSRLIFNLLIVASSVMIRGGTVAVRIGQPAPNKKQIIIKAQGTSLKWDPELDKIFTGNFTIAELNPKNVQAYFTKRLTDELEAELTYTVDGEALVMQVTRTSAS